MRCRGRYCPLGLTPLLDGTMCIWSAMKCQYAVPQLVRVQSVLLFRLTSLFCGKQLWKCSLHPCWSRIQVASHCRMWYSWLFIASSYSQSSSTEKALANQFLAPGRTPTTTKERTPATKTVHLQTKARCTGKMRSELLGTVCFGAAASLLLLYRLSLVAFGCLWWLCPRLGGESPFSGLDSLDTGLRHCARPGGLSFITGPL